jgi:colicin import membrane protein
MNAAAERLEFAPPATPGLLRALLLALLAHGLLVAALTWGVQWKQQTQLTSAEAELWASVPQEAAPKLQEPPPEPEPIEAPKPVPLPEPIAKPAPVVEPPKVDIALEQEKRRIQKQQQLELEKQQDKLKAEKLKQEKLLAEKLKQGKLLQDKLKAEKLQADQKKQELADKTKQAEDKKLTEQQAKQLEAQRQKNLQRMAGLAGASGDAGAKGTAQTAAGPTAGYAGRIRARIKPNIVFTEDIAGNPSAEVEVRTSADGTIIARKLLKSSGDKAWDEAVLKAIDKTEMLPRDTDGRVPAELVISFRPKD